MEEDLSNYTISIVPSTEMVDAELYKRSYEFTKWLSEQECEAFTLGTCADIPRFSKDAFCYSCRARLVVRGES